MYIYTPTPEIIIKCPAEQKNKKYGRMFTLKIDN